MAEKIVLAYSGGLDTSVAIRWLQLEKGYDVVALTIDVGNERDFTVIRERALAAGAIAAEVEDAKELFVRYFCFPALAANAMYEGAYPLATALGRPLIAKLLVDAARKHGAVAVAHGCTGKGNDQVRFDVAIQALAPDLTVVAPVREWRWARDEEIQYAKDQDIPVAVTAASPYSIDENLWGRSIELGILEDPWAEPPEEVYAWTKAVDQTPAEPAYLEVGFEAGIPVSLNDEQLTGLELVQRVHALAAEHGIGRIDHVENRLVGIKSREVYEAPAATVLLRAHQALESMTLSKPQLRFKERVAQEYADLIYNGLWFTAHHQDLAAYVQSTQRHVSGTVRVRLHRGQATVVGRKSPKSLYSHALATYDRGDQFDQSAAVGFIKLWGLPVQVQAKAQLLPEAREPLRIATPNEGDTSRA
jgi:argininosuccinate synthase